MRWFRLATEGTHYWATRTRLGLEVMIFGWLRRMRLGTCSGTGPTEEQAVTGLILWFRLVTEDTRYRDPQRRLVRAAQIFGCSRRIRPVICSGIRPTEDLLLNRWIR